MLPRTLQCMTRYWSTAAIDSELPWSYDTVPFIVAQALSALHLLRKCKPETYHYPLPLMDFVIAFTHACALDDLQSAASDNSSAAFVSCKETLAAIDTTAEESLCLSNEDCGTGQATDLLYS